MQIKMCFFVKNIVLLFLFTPNAPENGKNCRLLRFALSLHIPLIMAREWREIRFAFGKEIATINTAPLN